MAEAILKDSRLSLIYDTGMDEFGKPTFKTKSYANVRQEATADQLFTAANALASLSADTLSTIERTDKHDIF